MSEVRKLSSVKERIYFKRVTHDNKCEKENIVPLKNTKNTFQIQINVVIINISG